LSRAVLPVVLSTQLLIAINAAIVNIALPDIKHDLGFTDASLSWVVSAYLLAYGGLLLTGGPLGDLVGRRRIMLIGLTLSRVANAVPRRCAQRKDAGGLSQCA
jgi:MFS family permease